MSTELVRTRVEERVATLVLNRPEVRNALSPELIEALIEAFRAVERDPGVKCMVLRGEGEHFCGGGDVKGFDQTLALSPAERHALYERRLLTAMRLPNLLLASSKPVIVATRGAVAGAGLALCLAADFAIAGRSSFFLAAHVHIGLSLDSGLSGLLTSAMGIKAAKRLALLGQRIDVEQALALGIVSSAVADEELDVACTDLAQRLARGPAAAMAASKALLNHSAYRGFDEQLKREADLVAHCAAAEDFRHGIHALLAKRKPEFD